MRELRIVILEFANATRVDLMDAEICERDAVADFAGRVLRSGDAPSLPLLRSMSAVVPAHRVALLLNGSQLAEPQTTAVQRSPIPSNGLQHAMRAYGQRVISSARPETIAEAEAGLRRFFEHYGVEIEFGDGRPSWLKTPEENGNA